jgi:hypothetical protein
MRIISTIGRSWPSHGITIVVGENQIDDGDASRRALIEYLFAPFLECRQFVIEPEPAMAPKGVAR